MPANPPPVAAADRMKFTQRMKELRDLIRGIVIKNQDEAHRRVAKYYLMHTVVLPINSWVWVYNPHACPPEGDKLENRKLSIDWAGPHHSKGMANPSMARIARIDDAGQVIRRFEVHGSKVQLCHLGGQPTDDCRKWPIRPGMLPDFPDSEVSGPLYQPGSPEGAEGRENESVLPNDAIPQAEVQDEAYRTEWKEDNDAEEAPQWLEVKDVVMPEAMS